MLIFPEGTGNTFCSKHLQQIQTNTLLYPPTLPSPCPPTLLFHPTLPTYPSTLPSHPSLPPTLQPYPPTLLFHLTLQTYPPTPLFNPTLLPHSPTLPIHWCLISLNKVKFRSILFSGIYSYRNLNFSIRDNPQNWHKSNPIPCTCLHLMIIMQEYLKWNSSYWILFKQWNKSIAA